MPLLPPMLADAIYIFQERHLHAIRRFTPDAVMPAPFDAAAVELFFR